jgi:hypothetical protein
MLGCKVQELADDGDALVVGELRVGRAFPGLAVAEEMGKEDGDDRGRAGLTSATGGIDEEAYVAAATEAVP